LRFAGYISTVAVIGHKFAYEVKSSRNTFSMFTIGTTNGPTFHIMIYELAYINVANINIKTSS